MRGGAPVSTTTTSTGRSGAGSTPERQTGHVACARSHPSTHGAWNVCLHAGSLRTFSLSRTTLMHTVHCSAGPANLRRYSNTGMASTSSWLSPAAR